MNKKVKKSKGDMIFLSIVYVLMGIMALICLYPMWHVVMASFSDPIRLMGHSGVILKPLGHSLEGYKVVLQNPNIPISYRNTCFYVLAGTAINMVMTTLGAYALSRKGFMFKRTLTLLIVFTMYFNAGLVPNFLVVKGLGMYDSVWALLLPGAISTWNMIVMKTSFQSVPVSLEESARLDGANDFVILGRIFLPLSKATVAVMILFYAVGHWNNYIDAYIFSIDESFYPLQTLLNGLLDANSGGEGEVVLEQMRAATQIKFTSIIIATIPILIIYPMIEKHFGQGVLVGSFK